VLTPVNEYTPHPLIVKMLISIKKIFFIDSIFIFSSSPLRSDSEDVKRGLISKPLGYKKGLELAINLILLIEKHYKSYCFIFLYKVRSDIPNSEAAALRFPLLRSKAFFISSNSLS